jgi:hypothetical protein
MKKNQEQCVRQASLFCGVRLSHGDTKFQNGVDSGTVAH